MTLQGKQNHYNVKFLRRYGISINLNDNKIILRNCQNDITVKLDKEEYVLFRFTRFAQNKN